MSKFKHLKIGSSPLLSGALIMIRRNSYPPSMVGKPTTNDSKLLLLSFLQVYLIKLLAFIIIRLFYVYGEKEGLTAEFLLCFT